MFIKTQITKIYHAYSNILIIVLYETYSGWIIRARTVTALPALNHGCLLGRSKMDFKKVTNPFKLNILHNKWIA